jgi:hypothetical protein
MATVIFWTALALIVYVYVGYPLVLRLATYFCRPTCYDDAYQPTVSLIITAYYEEKVIQPQLDNALALDYPAAKLEIVVASDGSTDACCDLLCRQRLGLSPAPLGQYRLLLLPGQRSGFGRVWQRCFGPADRDVAPHPAFIITDRCGSESHRVDGNARSQKQTWG